MRRNTHRIFGCLLGYFLLFQTSEIQPQPASVENAKAKHQEISQAQLVSLTIIANKREIAVGERVPLKVRGKYSDATEREITAGITWAIGDANIAHVNSGGVLEALDPVQSKSEPIIPG
jgi:hypothetical protein